MFRVFWKRLNTVRNKTKRDIPWHVPYLNFELLLLGMNSLNRANISTGTTVGANIRINFIDVTF